MITSVKNYTKKTSKKQTYKQTKTVKTLGQMAKANL